MSQIAYRKHYIPLESNPDVFTRLIYALGVRSVLRFQDIWTLDEPEFLPPFALAVILILPTSDAYEAQKANEDAAHVESKMCAEEEDVTWFKQTINNACGLYAILHAVCNGNARKFIEPESILARLLRDRSPLKPHEQALLLEDSQEIETAYAAASLSGDRSIPFNAEDEVDYHFVCFVKSHKSRRIYELDRDQKGPIIKDRYACILANKVSKSYIYSRYVAFDNFGKLATGVLLGIPFCYFSLGESIESSLQEWVGHIDSEQDN